MRGDWQGAAESYRQAVNRNPRRTALLVQYGHSLKETADAARAAGAYRRAAELNGDDVDVRRHLAALLRGNPATAAEAVCLYRQIFERCPTDEEARRSLIELGARDEMPASYIDRNGIADCVKEIAVLREALVRAEADLALADAVPLRHYTIFRERHPISPIDAAPADITVLLRAEGASAPSLRATLASLAAQKIVPKRIWLTLDLALCRHPVASLAEALPTLRIVERGAPIPDRLTDEDILLVLPAGVVLDQHALEWLLFARQRTGLATVYSDHDTLEEDWRYGKCYSRPVLFGRHDTLMLACATEAPAMALISGNMLDAAMNEERDGMLTVRFLLCQAEYAVHVPRLLASIYRPPAPARAAPPQSDGQTGLKFGPDNASNDHDRPANEVEQIAVILPTRDQAAMLLCAVNSLAALAHHPERLSFIILDNRSEEAATTVILDDLRRLGALVLPWDEPFNWSRANNIGAAATDAPLLVFANNDIEMLSRGWDDVLVDSLAAAGVGVVGGRLLYPDASYQHAGVLFGVERRSMTVHEGVGRPGVEPGPNGRWLVSRRSSAVTGAFFATRRSTFCRVGGFNEQLAIAYNDLDFCFRVRSIGEAVIYEPRLTLTHYESLTRGRNVNRDQIAWDEGEQVTFASRWGRAALRDDPGYNPQWSRGGVAFDGMREPSEDEVLAWLDAAGDPWRPSPS